LLKKPAKNTSNGLNEWFETPFGKYLLSSEQALLKKSLKALGGYHLMHLSGAGQPLVKDNFGHSHGFSLATSGANEQISALADFETLPLPSDTIDTVLLHHALEFSNNPHQMLNEVARVVLPGGHLVLVVFNPYSFLGLNRLVAQYFSREPIWRFHSLRYGRLLDWLKLLNFQPLYSLRGCCQLPLQWPSWLKKTQFLQKLDGNRMNFAGSYYLIVARKQVSPLTPIGGHLWKSPLTASVMSSAKKTACHQKTKE